MPGCACREETRQAPWQALLKSGAVSPGPSDRSPLRVSRFGDGFRSYKQTAETGGTKQCQWKSVTQHASERSRAMQPNRRNSVVRFVLAAAFVVSTSVLAHEDGDLSAVGPPGKPLNRVRDGARTQALNGFRDGVRAQALNGFRDG